MWLGDWLFGRPDERAYRIDVDDVRDIVKVLEEEYPGIDVQVRTLSAGRAVEVDPSALETLSSAELQRLWITAEVPDADRAAMLDRTWNISLRRDATYFEVPQQLVYPNEATPTVDPQQVAARIRQKLSDASWPLLRRKPVSARALVTFVPVLLIAVAWVWVETTLTVPGPVHVLGWVSVLALTMLSVPLYRSEVTRHPPRRPPRNGHLVLGQTRRQTKADRAGNHRDLKVAALSVGGTILAGAILYVTLGVGG